MRTSHALAAAALTLTIASCGSPTITTAADGPADSPAQKQAPTSAPKKPNVARVGNVISLHGTDAALKIAVKLNKVINSGTASNDMTKPDAGNRLYGVELILKNTGTATYDDSPSNGAKVVDSEGQEYEASLFGEIAGTHRLESTTFSTGDVRKGVIVFEVPAKAKIVKFLFALNSGFADQKGQWSTR